MFVNETHSICSLKQVFANWHLFQILMFMKIEDTITGNCIITFERAFEHLFCKCNLRKVPLPKRSFSHPLASSLTKASWCRHWSQQPGPRFF